MFLVGKGVKIKIVRISIKKVYSELKYMHLKLRLLDHRHVKIVTSVCFLASDVTISTWSARILKKKKPFSVFHSYLYISVSLLTFPDYNLELPPWLCQPYVREPPRETQKSQVNKYIYFICSAFCLFIASLVTQYLFEDNSESFQTFQEDPLRKREYKDEDGNEISRKRSKKLKRIARRPNRATSVPKRSSDRCHACPNPLVC